MANNFEVSLPEWVIRCSDLVVVSMLDGSSSSWYKNKSQSRVSDGRIITAMYFVKEHLE